MPNNLRQEMASRRSQLRNRHRLTWLNVLNRHEAATKTNLRLKRSKTLMTEQESFRPSDFSLRDIPGFIVVYLIISATSVALGLLVEQLPNFWNGVLLGVGGGMLVSFLLLGRVTKQVDVAALPTPSAEVRAKLDDPNCSIAEAVKAYRDETGLGLFEAKAALDSYNASKHRLNQDEAST